MTDIDNRLATLNKRLGEHADRVKQKKAYFDQAEQQLQEEERQYYEVQLLRDQALVESWGGEADWSVLLDDSSRYSMYIYDLCTELLGRVGLRTAGAHHETRQKVLVVGFESGSDYELAEKRDALNQILPFIRAPRGEGAHICVESPEPSHYALCLKVHRQTGRASLCRLVFGREDDRTDFLNLGEALSFIQRVHPDMDYVEARSSETALRLQ